MRTSMLTRCLTLLLAIAPCVARGQRADSVRATTGAQAFHLEIGAFLHSLDQGYGTWRGGDARLMWTSPRATPFVFASTQSREAGATSISHQTFGAGSYLTLSSRLSAIVSASIASSQTLELY